MASSVGETYGRHEGTAYNGHFVHLLTLPVRRPSRQSKVFYYSLQYQAKSWKQSRRVVAKAECHQGELSNSVSEEKVRANAPIDAGKPSEGVSSEAE